MIDNTQPDHIVDAHEMVVDTNQASEGLKEILIRFSVSIAEYVHFGSPFNSDDENIAGAEALYQTSLQETKTAIQDLIRTEKLKAQIDILQEGVSESKEFCGEDVDINLGWVNFKLNKLQQSLDKLEAEL